MEIGPQLPPGLASKVAHSESHGHNQQDIRRNCNDFGDRADSDKNDELFGPVLPPGFKTRPRPVIGPCRPELITTELCETDRDCFDKSESAQEDEDEVIGPVLPSENMEEEFLMRKKEEIDSRARFKQHEEKDLRTKRPVREEWMTELPPEIGKNFGLGPRKFKNRNVDVGDRSVWTETPSDRENNKIKKLSETNEPRHKSKKELSMEKYVNEHNKRYRSESLLDLHQKEQKKIKKKQGSASAERRPFDRETDLGAQQMDAAKRKSLIKKSAHLNSKFEHSKQGPTYL